MADNAIKLTITLTPTADGRHDLTIDPEGIGKDEIPRLLEWVLLQVRLNKRKKLKLIK